MPISNMQQARQMYEYGGLSAPRQNYGLGSFVKKAVRGVKKIAKSPIGKAALMYAGTAGLGALAGGAGGTGFGMSMFRPSNIMSNFGGSGIGGLFKGGAKTGGGMFSKMGGGIKDMWGGMSTPQKLFAGASGAALAAPFLMGGDGPEEVVEDVVQLDPGAAVQSAKDYYSGLGNKGAGLNFMPRKKYVDQNFYMADGGRAGYAMGGDIDEEEEFIRSGAGQRIRPQQAFLAMGGGAGEAQAEQMLQAEFIKYKNKGGELSFQEFVQAVMQQQQAQGMQQPTMAADGGRMGYGNGGDPLTEFEIDRLGKMGYDVAGKGMEPFGGLSVLRDILRVNRANGGRMNAAEGGIMDAEAAEMIDMGGQEKDYRDEGGFVAMGGEERADDVPARLSKNEFVFTADAVRAAGNGDIDQGSEVMQNMMDNLEQGGQISEDSQGMGGGEEMMSEEEIIEEPNGAQAMYEQQQMLQSRME
jgi:hypothetical protein